MRWKEDYRRLFDDLGKQKEDKASTSKSSGSAPHSEKEEYERLFDDLGKQREDKASTSKSSGSAPHSETETRDIKTELGKSYSLLLSLSKQVECMEEKLASIESLCQQVYVLKCTPEHSQVILNPRKGNSPPTQPRRQPLIM
jgi:hypothetical protein